MLAAVDLDDELFLEANEVENQVPERNLSAKLVSLKTPIAEQSPHPGFGVSRFSTHLLCECADTLGGRPMMWRLRREPLTRRLTS